MNSQLLRRKFALAEQIAKRMYDERQHQNDTNVLVEDRPLFVLPFFEYFDCLDGYQTTKALSEVQKQRNLYLNRCVIRQQPVLGNNENIQLNDTSADRNRENGTGQIAGTVRVVTQPIRNENMVSEHNESSSTSHSRNISSRRRNIPSSVSESLTRSQRRKRSHRVPRMSRHSTLPPSTGKVKDFHHAICSKDTIKWLRPFKRYHANKFF